MKKSLAAVTALLVIVLSALVMCATGEQPRNVILIVPDGASIATWAAVRAITVGTRGALNIDRLTVQSRCRTYSANQMITDSAAAATALACGGKARNGVLSMDAATVPGDSLTGKRLDSILELAERAGYATGIVTTTSIQHATPAAFYTHQADRNWYNLIAADLVGKGIEVILGGGRQFMIPQGTTGEEGAGSRRTDDRNIIEELRSEGYVYVCDKKGFDAADPLKTDKLLGIFNPDQMQYEYNRKKDRNGEPGLWEMAEKALGILSKNRKGFFLMIEAGRIDHAAHGNDTIRYLWDAIACEKTVGVARNFALENKNTLLIVVPDHGCGGPHLIGLRDTASADSMKVSAGGLGFPAYELDSDGFPVSDGGKPIAIGWASSPPFLNNPNQTGGSHTGEDVGIHAMGPGSEALVGLMENTDIFTVMALHLGVGER